MLPTDEQLAQIDELLRYDLDTGHLFWRKDRRRVRAGMRAGFFCQDRWRVMVAGMLFYAEDVAWFLGHGEWPPSRVVHFNGLPLDNSLDNLELSDKPARGILSVYVPAKRARRKPALAVKYGL